ATLALIRAHGEGLSIQSDLRDRSAAAALVRQVEDAWGGIDVLVNNAGVSEAVAFVLLEDDDWDDVMELNVNAVFRLARAPARSSASAAPRNAASSSRGWPRGETRI